MRIAWRLILSAANTIAPTVARKRDFCEPSKGRGAAINSDHRPSAGNYVSISSTTVLAIMGPSIAAHLRQQPGNRSHALTLKLPFQPIFHSQRTPDSILNQTSPGGNGFDSSTGRIYLARPEICGRTRVV